MDLYNPLILLPVLTLAVMLYYVLPKRWQQPFLLLFSLFLVYSLSPQGMVVLLLLAGINWGCGLYLAKTANKTILRTITIILNLAVFALPRLLGFGRSCAPAALDFLLPVGLAFITLQNIGYLLDVSRSIIPAETSFWKYLLYLLFFPKLNAGPIEPARRFLPQLSTPKEYDPHAIQRGILQICMGLFKKLVVADRLALIVDAVFDQPGTYHGLTVLTAIAFYSFQIYFDFSGYTDIALGIARMFGYDLSPNFKKPFLAENINEFWNRWHITFTGWLREYIFFPLRRTLLRKRASSGQFLALFIPPLATMLASGLWHGFQPTYLVWGLYHGLLLYANTAGAKKKRSSPTHSPWPGRMLTFAMVSFGFLFFRSASLADAGILLQSIFVKSTTYHDLLLNILPLDLILSFTAIILIMGFETYLHDRQRSWSDLSFPVQWAVVLILLLAISIVGVYQPINTEFIYAAF